MNFDLNSILGSKAATAVRVNGLAVPVDLVPKSLQGYSEPALFHNPDFPEYELTRRGTLLKGHYRGKFFALVTAHQASLFEYDQLVIHEKTRSNASSSGACTYSKTPDGDETELDCRLYDFTKPVLAGALPRTGWLNFEDSWLNENPDKASVTLVVGYPTSLNEIDQEKKHISKQAFSADGFPITPQMPLRNAIEFGRALEVDPDGLSGAPVYGMFVDIGGVRLALLGIVTNASRNIANYLPVSEIRRYLKRAFSGEPSQAIATEQGEHGKPPFGRSR